MAKASDQKREHPILVRLNIYEKRALDELATQENRSRSNLIVMLIREAAENAGISLNGKVKVGRQE